MCEHFNIPWREESQEALYILIMKEYAKLALPTLQLAYHICEYDRQVPVFVLPFEFLDTEPRSRVDVVVLQPLLPDTSSCANEGLIKQV